MKNKLEKFLLVFSFISLSLSSRANPADDHKHEHSKKSKETTEKTEPIGNDNHKDDEDDHEKSKNPTHTSDKSNEAGENKNVGPNKGITIFDEEKGFVLSDEAKKTFSLQTQNLTGSSPWSLPKSALLFTGEEKSVYRLRDGFFKKIDVEVIKKDKDRMIVKSENLKKGDSIVIQGVGFIRIAEVDATSEESSHGH